MHLLSSRILMSMGMIVFVGALAVGATGAFFSDTESSTGNTFAAGALDLTIDNTSYGYDWNRLPQDPQNPPTGVWGPNPGNSWQLGNLDNCGDGDDPCLFFSFGDLKPGDYGEDTISLHVQNDAWACMAFDLTATPDNGINDPEDDAGDITDGALGGELQNYLSFLFWYDDGDNVLEVGEQVIDDLSGAPGDAFTGEWLAIAEGGETPDTPLQGDAVTPTFIGKGWCFGTMVAAPVPQGPNTPPDPLTNRVGFTCNGAGDHNVAQTDGITVDVHFFAEQSRNNGDFLCANLDPINEPPAPLAQCQDGIDNADTEDVLIDAADPGCHSDGNAINSQTYVPTDNDETDVPGTLTINKIVVNDPIVGPPAGTAIVTDFEFQVDAGLATAFEGDGSNAVSVTAGAHTVVEVPEVNYITTYSNSLNANADCNALVVPSAGNVTCTITNTFDDIVSTP